MNSDRSIPGNGANGLMVLGLTSLCNHADEPNADVRFDEGGAVGWIAVLYALSDIAQGPEITYRYRGALWFAFEQAAPH